MKANELMIGDWINVLARFLEISEEYTATSGHYNGVSRKACRVGGINGEDLAIDKICTDVIAYEPIPLTEEILKKNRFEKNGIIWDFPNNSFFGVMIDNTLKGIYSTYNMTAFFRCGYVHELQRALRCCGLFDLADNFKIE